MRTTPEVSVDDSTTPVILLGGRENLVSAARALLARGVAVTTVADAYSPGHRVSGVIPVPLDAATEELLGGWIDRHLLGSERQTPPAVVIPLNDPALLAVADRYDALVETHRPILLRPDLVRAMLNKQEAAERGRVAGIAVPRQWEVASADEVDGIVDELRFPVLVKPNHTFELNVRSGRKFERADDLTQLRTAVESLSSLDGGFTINQFIEGPDTRLASYYALRQDGRTLLSLTKRVYRRFPVNQGGATLHELCDLPEVAKVGERFFDHVGIEGLANVEFKQSYDDGEWYLIECNHRLTAATELMQSAGMDLVGAVYRQALGLPVAPSWNWDGRARFFWYPVRDFRSALGGEPGLGVWLATAFRKPIFPYWDRHDRGPSMQNAMASARRKYHRRIKGRLPGG